MNEGKHALPYPIITHTYTTKKNMYNKLNTVNNSPYSNSVYDCAKPQSIGLDYAILFKRILRLFPGLSRHDVNILYCLEREGFPLSYSSLYDTTGCSYELLSRRLHYCMDQGYINRKQQGRNVAYTITQDGIKLLYHVNSELEFAVKAKLERIVPK